METLRSSDELKQNAKEKLMGRYAQVVPVHFMYILVCGMLPTMEMNLSGQASLWKLLLGIAISFLGGVLANLLHFGICCYYMNLSCGFRYGFNDIFRGFNFQDQRPVQLALMYSLVQFLCTLPGFLINLVYQLTQISWLMPLASLLFCIGLAAYLVFYLGASRCYYLLLDFPQKNVKELLKISRWLMNGRKLRLFYLYVSFVPLCAFSLLSCGLGLFWILPYMEETLACFHLNLSSVAAAGN